MQLTQYFKNHLTPRRPFQGIGLPGCAKTYPIRPRGIFTSREFTAHIVLLALAIIATHTSVHAQSAATGIAKDVARGSNTVRLSIDALCAQLTLDEVTAILGKNFERKPDKEEMYQFCKYGDNKEQGKLQVRYFSLGSSRLNESGWRRFVESDAKGKVIERDGVLVSHLRRDKFGADSIWFRDRKGHALELNVNSGVTENQAVALAKAAMD
ncbi:MAG: hypothetical protein ABL964_00655 [Steroidobacteraceae bacterium]